jgi:HK97 family phage major capsid protein
MKLKQLQEQRGEKLKEIRKLLDSAGAANRALNDEESTKLKGLEGEIEGLDRTVEAEVRQLSRESAKAPQLSEREERDVAGFDYQKLLRSMKAAASGGASTLEGIEREMVQEGEREAREAGVELTGIMLPRLLVRRVGERRDMTATGGTNLQQGGMTIQTDKVGLADDFYNASVLRQNGALVLEGLTGNLDMPRYVAPANPAHKAENANSDEVSPTTAMLQLRPRRLPAHIDISEQLLRQSSVVIEAIVRRNLTEQMLAVQETAFFHGTGSGNNQPTGIAGTVGIGSVVGGTDGANPDWADIVDLESKVAVQNAAVGNLRYLTNAKVRAQLKKTAKIASTDSLTIWDDRNGGFLNGYTPVVTNAVRSDLVKGTSGAVCSAIFFGNVNDFVIAYWGGISLELVRDKALGIAGMYTLIASTYYDGGVLRPKSFAAMLDALTPGA